MYEWPASIAPEPNNYEFISSSRSIFFSSFSSSSCCCCCWLAEQRIHSDPASERRPARHFLPAKKKFPFRTTHKKHTYLVLHLSPASVIVVFIYSGVCGASRQPLLLIVCQSSPRSGRQTAPSPSRRPLAGNQNRKLP